MSSRRNYYAGVSLIMLLVPLSRKDQIGIPPLTVLVILVCIALYLLAADEKTKLLLAYYPDSLNLLKMISSVFVHADIFHLLGNLFFFYCFARAVEIEITSRSYILVFLAVALLTNIVYSLASKTPLPTLGMSGVVWGFMGVFLMRYPKENINCFVWYLWVIKVVEVPSYIFVLAFLAFDLIGFREQSAGNVNHIAHISGFFLGVFIKLLAWDYMRLKRKLGKR